MNIKKLDWLSALKEHSVSPFLINDEKEELRIINLDDYSPVVFILEGITLTYRVEADFKEDLDFSKALKNMDKLLSYIKALKINAKIYTVYTNKKIYIYDVYINDNWMSEKDIKLMLKSLSIESFYIPCVSGVFSLDEIKELTKTGKNHFIIPAMYLDDERNVEWYVSTELDKEEEPEEIALNEPQPQIEVGNDIDCSWKTLTTKEERTSIFKPLYERKIKEFGDDADFKSKALGICYLFAILECNKMIDGLLEYVDSVSEYDEDLPFFKDDKLTYWALTINNYFYEMYSENNLPDSVDKLIPFITDDFLIKYFSDEIEKIIDLATEGIKQ